MKRMLMMVLLLGYVNSSFAMKLDVKPLKKRDFSLPALIEKLDALLKARKDFYTSIEDEAKGNIFCPESQSEWQKLKLSQYFAMRCEAIDIAKNVHSSSTREQSQDILNKLLSLIKADESLETDSALFDALIPRILPLTFCQLFAGGDNFFHMLAKLGDATYTENLLNIIMGPGTNYLSSAVFEAALKKQNHEKLTPYELARKLDHGLVAADLKILLENVILDINTHLENLLLRPKSTTPLIAENPEHLRSLLKDPPPKRARKNSKKLIRGEK